MYSVRPDRDTFGEFGISVLTFDCRDQRKHAVNLLSVHIYASVSILDTQRNIFHNLDKSEARCGKPG